MAFSMACSNAGCGKIQAPYIDKESKKVYCSECHKELLNVSPFIQRQMLMNKQFRKKEQKSFAVKCGACNIEDRPKIVNDEIVCSACEKKLDNLTPTFIAMLKLNLAKAEQDI